MKRKYELKVGDRTVGGMNYFQMSQGQVGLDFLKTQKVIPLLLTAEKIRRRRTYPNLKIQHSSLG
jgi:hypothetical protein